MWRFLYVIFRAVSGLSFWVERRFTHAGMLVLGVLIIAAVFGIDTSLTLAYRIFALSTALLLLSMIAARFGSAQLVVHPRLPHTLTAGEPFALRLDVRNLMGSAVDGVRLRVELGDPRPDLAQFRAQLKLPTYRGWTRLLWANRVAFIDEAPLPTLQARAETQVQLHGQALKRGRLHIDGFEVARSDALGLFRKLTPIASGADICVLPKRYALPELKLSGARRYQPGGMPQGASTGDSEEFLGLRDYRPGDPLQRIHWRSFARLGTPVVKEYQDEYIARYALVLDTLAPAATENANEAFEEAVAVAASFAWTIDTQECLLDLMFVGSELHSYTAGRGHLLPSRLLEVLAGVRMRNDGELSLLLEQVRARRSQLSACICILLSWDEQRRQLIDTLRAGAAMVLPLLVTTLPPPSLPPGIRVLTPGGIAEQLMSL
jgi:uncharacterized protein (DUF58 family)